jgi:hypothetical protein
MEVLLGYTAAGVTSIRSFIGGVTQVAAGMISSVAGILLSYCTGIVGALSLTWAATQLVAACALLNTQGYYYTDSALFGWIDYVHG